MSENTPDPDSILAAIPEFPDVPDDAAEQQWLNDRINHALAHVTKVSEAGIPMGLITLVVVPEEESKILIPGQAPRPQGEGKAKHRNMVESPAITVAQQVYGLIQQGMDIDDEGRKASLGALAQTKIALERAHQIVTHLIQKISPLTDAERAAATEAEEPVPGGQVPDAAKAEEAP